MLRAMERPSTQNAPRRVIVDPTISERRADEQFLLGLIAGCCNAPHRDDAFLELLVTQLRLAQRARSNRRRTPDRH